MKTEKIKHLAISYINFGVAIIFRTKCSLSICYTDQVTENEKDVTCEKCLEVIKLEKEAKEKK